LKQIELQGVSAIDEHGEMETLTKLAQSKQETQTSKLHLVDSTFVVSVSLLAPCIFCTRCQRGSAVLAWAATGYGSCTLCYLINCLQDRGTWAVEGRSPDGMWIASAQTIEHGGLGTVGVETPVTIKRSKGSESSERVLAFAEGCRALGLKMRWDGPAHLIVVYHRAPELLYLN
jgi:hypothetical protein